VQRFATTQEAKEFLVGRIAGQALRSGIAHSDVERKMLYFSESDSIQPEIADANAAFERECDRAQYERKISKVVRQLRARQRRENAGDFDLWKSAIEKLSQGDHYLLVMVEQAGRIGRPRADIVKLLAVALLISAVLLTVVFFLASR
jgi:hypothetical protein